MLHCSQKHCLLLGDVGNKHHFLAFAHKPVPVELQYKFYVVTLNTPLKIAKDKITSAMYIFLRPWPPLCKREGVRGYEPKPFSTHLLCDDRVPGCKSPWRLFGGPRRLPWWISPTLTGISGSTVELVNGSRRLSGADAFMCTNAHQCAHACRFCSSSNT